MKWALTGIVVASFASLLSVVACAPSRAPETASTTLSSGSSAAPVADVCRGATFDADDADPRCLRSRVTAPPPAAKDLQVTLHADSVAKAGHEAVLVLEMRNVSSAPLTLDVDSGCAFKAVATNGEASSFETDCGGLCTSAPEAQVLHVALAPQGVIVKRVHFYATELREIMGDKDRCEQHSAGPLPPGRYTLSVALPWADPDNTGAEITRKVEGTITVTP
jgi:hypothetical protein